MCCHFATLQQIKQQEIIEGQRTDTKRQDQK